MQQPIFLELEAPLKICGTYQITQVTSMDSILTSLDFLITASTLLSPIISFSEIMLTEANFHFKQSVY